MWIAYSSQKHGTDSDGLVPTSAVIEGAVHLADFPNYHLDR